VNEPARAKTCPSCKRPVGDNAVLCIACGYNLESGYHLRTKSLIRKEGIVGRTHLGTPMRSDLPDSLVKLVSVSKTAGIVCLLMASLALSLAVLMATMPEVATQIHSILPKLRVVILAGPGTLSCILGILALIVSNKAKQGLPAARSLGLLTATLMLLLVPIGALFGLIMLALLLHPNTKRFYR